MNEELESRINDIGAKIDIVESLHNAIMSGLLGADCISEKDVYNFVYLLEDKIKDLKLEQDSLIDDLRI